MSNNRGKNGGLCDKIENKTCFWLIFMSNYAIFLCDKKLTEKMQKRVVT